MKPGCCRNTATPSVSIRRNTFSASVEYKSNVQRAIDTRRYFGAATFDFMAPPSKLKADARWLEKPSSSLTRSIASGGREDRRREQSRPHHQTGRKGNSFLREVHH